MSLDLLTSRGQFPDLKIYVEKSFSLSDEEIESRYGFIPRRENFSNIPWDEDLVYFIKKDEFSKVHSLVKRFSNVFLVSFDEVPENLREVIFQVSSNNIDVIHTLDFLRELIIEQKKMRIQENAESEVSRIFKEAGQYITELESNDDNRTDELVTKFLKLDRELLLEDDLNEFIKKTNTYFQSLNLWSDLQLTNLDTVFKKVEEGGGRQIYLSLNWLGFDNFLVLNCSNENTKRVSFGISLLLEWLERYSTINAVSTDENQNLWEEIISQLPFPLALINEQGDLLIHNPLFIKLNIPARDCLQFENDEALEIKMEYFKVKRINIEKENGAVSLFLFVNSESLKEEKNIDKTIKSISSQELGIISSSIAHELNNPLAGILAAIALLELDDWENDELAAINDMKVSAKRCKNLVEIFLGFSRAKDREQRQGTMRDVLGQSLDLLRFRMIESDIRIEVDVESGGEPFKRYVNLSVCSMIIYLVLGEILTMFNHHRLVLGDNDLKTLKTIYREEYEKVSLQILSDIEISTKIKESKLINYLIDTQGLEMDIEKNKITFMDWKLI